MPRALRFRVAAALVLASAFASAAPAFAGNNPADFPVRVLVFNARSTRHFHGGVIDYVDGDGYANVFVNGEVQGVDFAYSGCSMELRHSSGFETYPAKWKKPNLELVLLEGVIGKPNDSKTCNVKVQIKPFVYVRRNGMLNTEPAADFKKWMIAHKYDPEHGLEMPERAAPAAAATAPAAAAPVPAPAATPNP